MQVALFTCGMLGFRSLGILITEGYRPCVVFTDKNSNDVIDLAKMNNIPLFVGNPRGGRGLNVISNLVEKPDVILSVNYIFLLDDDIINFPRLGCVNFHGSLLPKYRGRTPHVWAIINNERLTGISCHYIATGCDSGPIIFQVEFEILPDATGGMLLELFAEQLPAIILETLDRFKVGKPVAIPQDETVATYFGKRTADDGYINWSWQKERIRNWVRAQAYPYPGAFTFDGDTKVVIDRIDFCDTGYYWDVPDGTVIRGGIVPEVKTANGVVKLTRCRDEKYIKEGSMLK